jgi:hypothetical protein
MLEGLTPAEAAVLEPPYHPRLDRPALTLKGEVAVGAVQVDSP